MHKLKGFFAVGLAFGLLIAGAFFPKLIFLILDWKHTDTPSLNPIQSVQLELNQNISSLGKLAMLSNMSGYIALDEKNANLTQEEVLNAIYAGITPYISAQLVTYSEKQIQMNPYLVQVLDNQKLQSIVWIVTISDSFPSYHFFDLMIDDETGHILLINYSSDSSFAVLTAEEALSIFADIYFTNLGIDDYADFLVPDLEYAYAGDNAVAVRYRFHDTVYGDINVDLFASEQTFYLQFPKI